MEKKSIGSFMAALRKSYGMTQQEVADRLNVSNKTVSKWERDESYPEITLIPVIAELFNVTSDDILRGERVSKDDMAAGEEHKSDGKVDKQLKRLISSNITRIKNISYIAMALCFTGLICLFTISYAFYRPVLGFGIFLLFITASVVLELVQQNMTNTSMKENDLLEGRSELLIPLQNTRSTSTYTVILLNAIAVIFGLPLIMVRSSFYTNSVITAQSYLSLSPVLTIISWVIYKLSYWFLKKALIQTKDMGGDEFPHKAMRNMNIYHCLALAVQYLMLALTGWGEAGQASGSVSVFAIFLPIIFLLTSMLVYILRGNELKDRLLFALAGARNILLGFAGLYPASMLRSHGRINGQIPGIMSLIICSSVLSAIAYEVAKHKLYKNAV